MRYKPERCPKCNKYIPDKCVCPPVSPAGSTRWKSVAEWPEGTTSDVYGECRSEDTHQTKAQAEAVCLLLHTHGFGGMGRVFPIQTWVEPIA